jgi:hypothetical protein
MTDSLWGRFLDRYAGGTAFARSPGVGVHPARQQQYAGKWVAVKRGRVVATADTSIELAIAIIQLDDAGRGADMQFIRPQSDVSVVGRR